MGTSSSTSPFHALGGALSSSSFKRPFRPLSGSRGRAGRKRTARLRAVAAPDGSGRPAVAPCGGQPAHEGRALADARGRRPSPCSTTSASRSSTWRAPPASTTRSTRPSGTPPLRRPERRGLGPGGAPQLFLTSRGEPGPGFGHVALRAPSTAGVRAARATGPGERRQRRRPAGAPPSSTGPDYYAAYLRDPDGLRVEVMSARRATRASAARVRFGPLRAAGSGEQADGRLGLDNVRSFGGVFTEPVLPAVSIRHGHHEVTLAVPLHAGGEGVRRRRGIGLGEGAHLVHARPADRRGRRRPSHFSTF